MRTFYAKNYIEKGLSLGIVQGNGVGGHHVLATSIVVVGLAPIGLAEQLGYLIPVHVMIVVGFGTELHGLDFAIFATIGVGREEVSLRGKIVELEGYGASIDEVVVVKQATSDIVQILGRCQTMGDNPRGILRGYLHGVKDGIDLMDGVGEFAMGTLDGLLPHLVSGHSQKDCKREGKDEGPQ